MPEQAEDVGIQEFLLPESISPNRGEYCMLDNKRNRDAIYQANGIHDKISDICLHSSPNP
jgi:hypothetical protein